MNTYKVYTKRDGIEGFCDSVKANSEIGAWVIFCRSLGVSFSARVTALPNHVRIEKVG